ncbi:hypothetical protein LTR15_008418 [Elasticomyces elasticus]|nr:hypothetical protein LTR15_008418 [Elasticomyces elasticus]
MITSLTSTKLCSQGAKRLNKFDSDFESENEMPADMYEYWDKDGDLVEYKGKMRIDEINRKHEEASLLSDHLPSRANVSMRKDPAAASAAFGT